jgi:pimeloyl-ACP methyl ester carboxylesterase
MTTRRQLMGGVAALGLVGAITAGPASAETIHVEKPRTFVLVHGAWHGGWCWRDVRVALEARGYRVLTPTLTGLGERAHLLNADIGLDTHIEDVCRVIEWEEVGDVILCGHSYGGMVVTGVADRLKDRIAHVVYLDAALPRDGQSMITQNPAVTNEMVDAVKAQLLGLSSDGGLTLGVFPPALLGVPETDVEATAWLTRRLTPHPAKTWLDPITLLTGGADGLPRTYVHCTAPVLQGTAFPFHAAMAMASPHWRYFELKTGHDAMITDVAGTLAVLLQAMT